MMVFFTMIFPLYLLFSSSRAVTVDSQSPEELPAGYREIFFEDFKYFNKSIWNVEHGNGEGVDGDCDYDLGCPNLPGYGNGEIQYYSANNIRIVNDNLVLFSTYNRSTKVWNSGRINSMHKFSFTYGLIQVRLKVSEIVSGIFPAFWLLPESLLDNHGWPYNGEIDVFEFLRDWNVSNNGIYFTPSTFHFGAHFAQGGIQFVSPPQLNVEEYHIYGVDWQPNRMIVFRDSQIIGIYNKPAPSNYEWPFDHPFHLICNLAIQPRVGSLADESTENQFLAIDWIRISQSG